MKLFAIAASFALLATTSVMQDSQARVQQLQAPQLQAPQLQAPQLQAPQLQAPQLQAPQLQAPPSDASTPLPPPGMDLSYYSVMKGDIRSSFRLRRSKTEDGIHIWQGRSRDPGECWMRLLGSQRDLCYADLEVELRDRDVFAAKLIEYFHPPLVETHRSGIGGVGGRTFRAPQPAPYAFRNRKTEEGVSREINNNVYHLADFVRNALPEIWGERKSQVKTSRGVLLHDSYLNWVTKALVAAILYGPVEIADDNRVIIVEFDPFESRARIRIWGLDFRMLLRDGHYEATRRLLDPPPQEPTPESHATLSALQGHVNRLASKALKAGRQ